MSRYTVSVGKRTYDITIENTHLLVNGDRFKFDMESLNGNGLHMLRHPNQHIEAYLQSNRHGSYEVQIGGEHVNARVDFAHRTKDRQEDPSANNLKSQMPGLIVDILIKEGQRVTEEETLLIQEAMKMQMKLRSPCDGVIRRIHVDQGLQVEKDILLVSIDPDSTSEIQNPNGKEGS